MTSRQARRERREAERKAKKVEMKRMKTIVLARTEAIREPESNQNGVAVMQRAIAPEEEFSAGFIAEAAAIRDRIHRKAGLKPEADSAPQQTSAASKPCRAEINRANAQLSTGPSTLKGKMTSSRNSLKHGLASGTLIIPGENPAELDSLLGDLLEEHQPATQTEEILVQEMAQSWWLEQRAIRFQNECFITDGINEKRLSLFLRYQTTHARAFHKALAALLRLQKERRKLEYGFVSQDADTSTISTRERQTARTFGICCAQSVTGQVASFRNTTHLHRSPALPEADR
jgi:hypothetical protein